MCSLLYNCEHLYNNMGPKNKETKGTKSVSDTPDHNKQHKTLM